MDFLNWISGIWEDVVNWVTSPAVTDGVLNGAVAGVVIGGASAALSGDDILDGALMGAAYGGIAGGVVGGLTDQGQKKAMGGTNDPASIVAENMTHRDPMNPVGGFAPPETSEMISKIEESPTTLPLNKNEPKGWDWTSDEAMKLYGGIGSGAAIGAGNYLSTKEKTK